MNETNITADSLLSPGGYLATGVYVMIVGMTGTIGNTVVILVILKYWSRTNISRKPHLPMTLSLALSDLGITFFGYPYTSISGYAGRWMFNDNVCLMAGFSCFFLSMASLDVLVAISVYRYIVICKPELKINLRYRTTALVLVGCWVYAFVWAAPPLFGISGYTYEPFGTACSMDWDSRKPIDIAFLVGTDIFCFLIHLVILVFCYTKIFLRYRYLMSPKDINLGKTVINREMRVTWMSFVTVMVFVIVWSPYAVVCTWMVFSDTFPKEYSTLPTMFAKSSCAFNPILYGAFDKQFRQVAKRIVCPWMFRHVKPSMSHGGYKAKYAKDESIFCASIADNRYRTPEKQLKTISSELLQETVFTDCVPKNEYSTRFDMEKYLKRNYPHQLLQTAARGRESAINNQADPISRPESFAHNLECAARTAMQQKNKNAIEICTCNQDLRIEGLCVQLSNSEDKKEGLGDKWNTSRGLVENTIVVKATPRPRLKTKSQSLSNMALQLLHLSNTTKHRKYSLDVGRTGTELVQEGSSVPSVRVLKRSSSSISKKFTDVTAHAKSCIEQEECQPNVAEFLSKIKASENFRYEDCNFKSVNYLWGAGLSHVRKTTRSSNQLQKQTFPKTKQDNIGGTTKIKPKQILKRSYNLCNDDMSHL